MLKSLYSRIFRRSLENPSTPIGGAWGGPNTTSGTQIDETSCLFHLPVYAAVNRIASDMALLDPQVVEQQPSGATQVAFDHNLEELLAVSPNGEVAADRWRQALFGHVLTWGNSYSEIEFDGGWEPIGLHLLDPSKTKAKRDPAGKLFYEHKDESGQVTPLPPWKVLHFAGLGFDGLQGYSPIAMARETLGLGLAADRFGSSFFGHSARPAGMLKMTKNLSDSAAKRLRQDFEQMFSGVYNTGRVIVGEDGMEFVPISIPPDDAQFLETRKMGVEDVARLFNIPAHKIGGAPAAGSIEEQNIDYLQSTLLGLCNMFEGEIKLKLLSGKANRRFEIAHDFKKLLKANAAARAQYNATAIQWGWATRNRVAQDEGYEPYKGGEAPLLPLNMVQIGPDGVPLPNPLPPQPATPTTSGTDSSSTTVTALAGIVRSLVDQARETRNEPAAVSPETVTAVEGVARAELSRALRRESAAVTRAAAKPGFRDAIAKLCDEHRAYLVESLGPSFRALAAVGIAAEPKAFAAAWCERSQSDLSDLEAVTTGDQRPAAVATMLESWAARIDTAWPKNGGI